MITDLLNAQTNLLWQWRGRLVELLARSIGSDSGEDADGKEYARSLETQGEAETFLHAYSVLLNDRREALFAEKSLLAAHDGRGKFKRATAAAMRALDGTAEVDVEMINDLYETRPEDQVLRQDLMEERLILLDPFHGRALKSIMVDLTNFALKHGKKLGAVATGAASALCDLISSQSIPSFLSVHWQRDAKLIPSKTQRQT
jgi:E3 ubiquitin-protein ligase SHPRH